MTPTPSPTTWTSPTPTWSPSQTLYVGIKRANTFNRSTKLRGNQYVITRYSFLSYPFKITYHCEIMPAKRLFHLWKSLLVKQTTSRLSQQVFCFCHRRATCVVLVCLQIWENAISQTGCRKQQGGIFVSSLREHQNNTRHLSQPSVFCAAFFFFLIYVSSVLSLKPKRK